MAHHHAHLHHVRRQQSDEGDDPVVATVVSVQVVTMPNTYTGEVVWVTQGPQTLVPPAVRSRSSTTPDSQTRQTSQQAASSSKPSSTSKAATTSLSQPSSLMVATQSPTPMASSAAAGLASATTAISAISATASAGATAGGMSAGAKAGLALGVLVGIAAILAGILVVYHRKKKQMAGNKDNEKIDMYDAPAPPPPQLQAASPPAPSIRTQRTMSTAPRLSLRPVTQFDPAFNEQRKSGGNLLNVAAAGGAAATSQNRDLPEPPSSAWERRGAANASAANPFDDPEHHPASPSANPFGNTAAVDAHQASIPDSPPTASPLHATQPSSDFADPAVAIAAAEVDPVAVAGAMHSVPPPVNEFPLPPSSRGSADGVPSSPAWTEDIPASPGPAPAGPPPVAGATVGSRPSSPASAPNNVHRIQLDFKASMQDELDLQVGQLVRMLHEYDDGWALCIRMDRSQQGVVPRTCLSKHPVKPRTGPPRQGPLPPGMRGPPIRSPVGVPQPRPLSPATTGRSSPHPQGLQPANGRMSPAPRSMSPGPRHMTPPQMQGAPRARSNSNAPQFGPPRGRSNSNAPYAGPPRSMSPGPYGGGPQMAPPPMGRPRANSASQASNPRRGPTPGPSPMNPNVGPIPPRKPVPGMAI